MTTDHLPDHLKGLTEAQVQLSRKQYGYNRMGAVGKSTWLNMLLDIVKEPILVLIFAISMIYVIVGDYGEALFMFLAIIAVSAISFYQDGRSKRALAELEKLNEPLSSVIRESDIVQIPTHEIVVGDVCVTAE